MTYEIAQLKLPLSYGQDALCAEAARRLRVPASAIESCCLKRRAVDARRKQDVHFVCTASVTLRPGVHVRESVLQKAGARAEKPYAYAIPSGRPLPHRPVVAGMGPGGLFAALLLAKAGMRPVVFERGAPVEERRKDVEAFWKTGVLAPDSNVQFGEGGAGTFSDGKLNTGTKDPRIRHVLETFVRAGAPDAILWEAKPHIGTDYLPQVVRNLRREILALGGEVHFHTAVERLHFAADGTLTALTLRRPNGAREEYPCSHLVLAVGHSARDTFVSLLQAGVLLEPKPFAVGVRIEHLQERIDAAQYGPAAGHPALGAADYKLAVHMPDGRGVYTFCMCPGGTVVAAASEPGRVVTNGMSCFARDGQNANAALLVGLTPDDFPDTTPLGGIRLQRSLEEVAFSAGGGAFLAPAQRVGDFQNAVPTTRFGSVKPSYSRGVRGADLHDCLPRFLTDALAFGLQQMGRRLQGFDDPDAVLTAVESRSSSPVRIVRGKDGAALGHPGLYPCGEGAGYAGGITSAAVDGLRCAEAILRGPSTEHFPTK